jgi:prepilin peptidase CpaA
MEALATTLVLATSTLLVLGAVTDVRTARIPNRLILVGLVLAAAAALAQGGPTGLGLTLLAGLVAFTIGFGGFALGAVGGGDAKFLVLGAALVGWPNLLPYLLAAAIAGGALALVYTVYRRAGLEVIIRTKDLGKRMLTLGRKGYRHRLTPGKTDAMAVPYGVAIAAGALLVQFTPFTEWLLP